MDSQKTSLICTVLNEEKTITDFLESVNNQSRLPDEVIIIDGGSKDKTISKILEYRSKIKNKFNLKVFVKKGNRSIGRNAGIKAAKGNIILSSDSGCILDKKWIEEIAKPFKDKKNDVVAGYYKGVSKTIFQKSLIPYALVMPDKIKEKEFLPATRSMAFRKNVWKKIGGFDEQLSHNEDYVFANEVKKANYKIVFAKKAIVYWLPRKNLKNAFVMFFRFAFGDGESGIIRDKVLLIFARYIFYLYLVLLSFLIKSLFLLSFLIILPVIYIVWSIRKNYKYVNHSEALIFLPVIQITSDFAVLIGTVAGFIKSFFKLNFKLIVKNNLLILILIAAYVLSMLFVIGTGIPGQTHPFPYQMDEWHQLQSVRNVFKFGTPNLPGSANGSMFHFFLSGILLIPFVLFRIVNPFTIRSAIDAIPMQEKIFIVLRLNTLFFGVLTLFLMSKIAKTLKLNQPLSVLLFFATSAWLVLSNFFKYDIALVFWIALSFYYLIKYSFSPTLKNFIFGSFFSALAFSVKVSALPLLPMLILAYLLFTPKIRANLKYLILGLSIYVFTAIFFGIPDIVFGGRSMFAYLYDNIISGPGSSATLFKLGEPLWSLTFFNKLPVMFGHVFYVLSIVSLIYVLILVIKNFAKKNYTVFKTYLFIVLSFLAFVLSLAVLGIEISANRVIVLLPFMVIFCLVTIRDLFVFLNKKQKTKIFVMGFLIIILSLQIFESSLWVYLKLSPLPEQTSSAWIAKYITRGSSIGLENIPLYQSIPDFILNEFYKKQYNNNFKTTYKYQIVNAKTEKFPKYIVISNVDYEAKYFKISEKNDLVKKIKKLGYKQIENFPLQLSIYNYFEKNYYTPNAGVFVYPESISIFSK